MDNINKNSKYYLIHNLDTDRKNIMFEEFNKWEFDLNNIKWMDHPNKDEITDELIEQIIIKEPSYSSGVFIPPERTRNAKGCICCTYKHYLCLKDIVDNNYDYGIIMEDNICFKGKIPELVNTYIKQLDKIYGEWDILFDGAWTNYIEGPTNPDVLVYPKTNEITSQCHGGTKAATFYLIKKECAKKLIQHYIPFNNSPDWWMNDLFRKLNIKSFWVEPSFVCVQHNHISTCK
jgi:GR25 family glycosyltransferase involved in LPS biosynthesis